LPDGTFSNQKSQSGQFWRIKKMSSMDT
jgi:hypothetical protein